MAVHLGPYGAAVDSYGKVEAGRLFTQSVPASSVLMLVGKTAKVLEAP